MALSANLVSKDFALIAVAIRIRAKNGFENLFWVEKAPNPLFLSSKNKELEERKSGSSIPLNILGGHRWPNAGGVDRELLRKIVRAEIGDTR